jgi:hypothetical protein
MEMAYKEGQAWLTDFLSRPLPPPKKDRSQPGLMKPLPVTTGLPNKADESAISHPELGAEQFIDAAGHVYPSHVG